MAKGLNHNRDVLISAEEASLLKNLTIEHEYWQELDLSPLSGLSLLVMVSNLLLTNVNLNGCSQLDSLQLSDSPIPTLVLSGTTNLTSLSLSTVPIEWVDLSGLTMLKVLSVNGTPISSLMLTNLPDLEWILCQRNEMRAEH
jgi:hypothetical protein